MVTPIKPAKPLCCHGDCQQGRNCPAVDTNCWMEEDDKGSVPLCAIALIINIVLALWVILL